MIDPSQGDKKKDSSEGYNEFDLREAQGIPLDYEYLTLNCL